VRWHRGGHLGASVSALVDGQLDARSSERAWTHVLRCPSCRRLVEREGWVKRQLATMSGDEPPARLMGSLVELDEAAGAWAAVQHIERSGRARRRVGVALVGAGSLSVAALGVAALGTVGTAGTPAPPASSVSRPAPTTPPAAVFAPAVTLHERTGQARRR
jgi:hypothetical protein